MEAVFAAATHGYSHHNLHDSEDNSTANDHDASDA